MVLSLNVNFPKLLELLKFLELSVKNYLLLTEPD